MIKAISYHKCNSSDINLCKKNQDLIYWWRTKNCIFRLDYFVRNANKNSLEYLSYFTYTSIYNTRIITIILTKCEHRRLLASIKFNIFIITFTISWVIFAFKSKRYFHGNTLTNCWYWELPFFLLRFSDSRMQCIKPLKL